jgi:hypothetical protein
MDKGGNRLSSFRLSVSKGQVHTVQQADRRGITTAVSNANDRLHQFNLFAAHHASWKLSPSALLQVDTRVSLDRNRDKLQASFLSDSLLAFFVDQLFIHHGKIAGTDLALVKQKSQSNARVGINASVESITSADGADVFIIDNLLIADCLADFKACNILKLRINDVTCGIDSFEFKMSGSTAALNYVINK